MLSRAWDFILFFTSKYDVTTEFIILVLVFIVVLLMHFSNPRKTMMMKLCSIGIYMAAVTIVLHILFLGSSLRIEAHGNTNAFHFMYVLYCISYVIELNLIFAYFNLLSFRRRSQIKNVIAMAVAYSVIYFIILFLPLIRNHLIAWNGETYVLTPQSNAYVLCSLLCGTFCFFTMLANRRDVSRIVYLGSVVFLPIELIGVLSQFYFPTAYYICATYFIPFLIFYLLFHSNNFDEVIGCQNYEAAQVRISNCIDSNQKFLLVSVFFPKLKSRDVTEMREIINYVGNTMCRKLEKISSSTRIYAINTYHYQVICSIKKEEEYELYKDKILKQIYEPISYRQYIYQPAMNILISRDFPEIKELGEYLSLINMKERQFVNQDRTEVLYAEQQDVLKNKRATMIEKNLLEIRDENQLDDDRVIVFIQPIYCVESGSFRTGEALMRMKIDGQMIFPDEFIPIAEEIGCIHSLTRIMLYKIACKTKELEKKGDFDAITVNVSTIEMTDPGVSQEFLDIIKKAGANPAKIRIEITESTTITDYDSIIKNMENMNDKGMYFYLDDFGTGYSNIERIVTIPFKTIKFDKSLLYKALEDEKTDNLLHVLIHFFKANGFSIVIEGVEDDFQREYVVNAGFDFIQGYFYSKPVPEGDVDSFYVNE